MNKNNYKEFDADEGKIIKAWETSKIQALVKAICIYVGITTDSDKEKYIRFYNNSSWKRVREVYKLERGEEYLLYRKFNLDLGKRKYHMRRYSSWDDNMKIEFILDSRVLPMPLLADKYNIKISTSYSYIRKYKKELGHVAELVLYSVKKK